MNTTMRLPLVRRSRKGQRTSSQNFQPQSVRSDLNKSKEFPIKFLRPSQDSRDGSMDAYAGSVGPTAKLDFYDTYINLPQFSQRNHHQNLEDSPNLAYLEIVTKHKLKPNPFGIVRRKGPETSIDIHSYSMGDTYALAFSEGIKHIKDVATLNLKANRLSDNGAASILKTLEFKQIKRIILSENRLSFKTINSLTAVIRAPEARLKVLELENTYLSDKALSTLCRVIGEDKKLVRLNLAGNNIGVSSIQALAEMMKYNNSIQYLDLHWNCLGVAGSSEFLEALGSNDGIVYLDLSYNSFGRKGDLTSAQALAKMFSANQYLQHVDLSNNYLSKKECEIIGEGLKDNHLVFGIHMQGNDCVVDSKGYLIPIDYMNKTEYGHLHRRLFENSKQKLRKGNKNNCWICENWVEISISWKPTSSEILTDPIYIHLDCDSYQQVQMFKNSSEVLEITRMVPPGMLRFFFSDPSNFAVSHEYNTTILDSPVKIEYPSTDGTKNFISVAKVNIIYIESEKWDPSELPSVKPRNDPRTKVWTEMVIERVAWSIDNSSFKDYKFDTEKLLGECCDYDIEVSRFKEIVSPEEQEEIKQIMKDYYKPISSAFRQLSAISGIELFSIGKNVLNEFLKKCNLMKDDFTLLDMGVLWNLANAPQSKGEKFNAGNGLCRYEFAEFLLRFAVDRFFKTKKCETIKASFEKLISEHLLPGLEKYIHSDWHSEKYLKEEVDLFFRLHKPVLEAIFFKYAAAGKGQIDRVNLHEFRLMCNEAGLCNENFVMREIDMCFRQAMMTEVDEILHGEHLQMVYVEFIEAIARIADQIVNDSGEQKIPLKNKLEKIFPMLLQVCPNKVVSSFEPPSESSYHNMKFIKKLSVMSEFIPSK